MRIVASSCSLIIFLFKKQDDLGSVGRRALLEFYERGWGRGWGVGVGVGGWAGGRVSGWAGGWVGWDGRAGVGGGPVEVAYGVLLRVATVGALLCVWVCEGLGARRWCGVGWGGAGWDEMGCRGVGWLGCVRLGWLRWVALGCVGLGLGLGRGGGEVRACVLVYYKRAAPILRHWLTFTRQATGRSVRSTALHACDQETSRALARWPTV